MVKISILGDIMCEPLMLGAARQKGGSYDFSPVFSRVKTLLGESDYVIGNLETPLAGEEAGYVSGLFSFNAPDAFAAAAKAAGVSFLSTANNHCMDRGLEGLKRTVRTLEAQGFAHDGTHEACDHDNAPVIVSVGDMKIAIVACTYGTNYARHRRALPDIGYVDLLHADTEPVYNRAGQSSQSGVKRLLHQMIKAEWICSVKKALGMTYNTARKDDFLDEASAKPFFDRLAAKLKRARESADYVIFYPHVGGQFNVDPGAFTEDTIQKGLEFGADVIVASHPHVVQKAVNRAGVPVFYSIGNFSMSPNSVYLLHENLPEYGLIVHLYLENGARAKVAFSIVRMIENRGELLQVWPVDQLPNPSIDEIGRIYARVTGKPLTEPFIRREYTM